MTQTFNPPLLLRRVAAFWLELVLLLGQIELRAVNPEPPPVAPDNLLTDYQVDVWTTEHGLPQNSILSIVQTQDGYLWLATFNGLARFDGVRFVIFDAANTPELKSSRIVALHADRRGDLWIRTESDDITHFANGRFATIGTAQGAPASGISCVGEDRAGKMWFGAASGEGFFRLEDNRLVKVLDGSGRNRNRPEQLLRDEAGALWALTASVLTRVDPPDLKSFPPDLNGIGFDARGRIIASSQDGVIRLQDGIWREVARHAVPLRRLIKPLEGRDGVIWGATFDGHLWKTGEDGLIRNHKLPNQIRAEGFRCIFEDAEGNIWIGSNGAGLYRVKPKAFRTLTPDDGLAGNIVKSVTQDANGGIWAMCSLGLNKLSAAPPRVLETRPGLTHKWVIRGDSEGYLWAGSYGTGLARRKDNLLDFVTFRADGFLGICYALHLDSKSNLWAGGSFGIVALAGLDIREHFPSKRGQSIRAIAEDGQGRFFFGTGGEGLLIREGEEWRQLRRQDGLPDDHIWALFADQQDVVWIGMAGGGLARLKDGELFSFSDHRWPVRSVYSIIEDDLQYLWLGSNQGLFRVRRDELNRFADGLIPGYHVQRYGGGDGLLTTEFAHGQQPVACKDRNGRLWFATVRGVVAIDPARLSPNTNSPPVVIEEILADDRPVPPGEGAGIAIRPGRRRVEIRYTALSFVAPEKVRFRVRFEGLDDDWVDVGTRRSVHYNRVPPGDYRFRVIACNNDGVWNETGASLAIAMLPHYWQTGWFAGLGAAAFLGVGFAIYHRRVGQLKQQRSVQQEFSRRLMEVQESERKRMAGELHDSLGQKLQLIRNSALLALRRHTLPEEGANPLREISGITGDAITEIRAITYALRPAELDQVGLSRALEYLIESMARASGLRLVAEVDAIDGLLTAENEMNLYRIVQESLNNVIKHAEATEVTVEIKRVKFHLTVTVFDNGRGFTPFSPATVTRDRGGMGLASVSERVRILGGEHQINSTIGKGTRLVVTIPLSAK